MTDEELAKIAGVELKPKLSPIDAAIRAEARTPEEVDFLKKGIFPQESNSGKNKKTSNAGAVGIGQIQPGTFKEIADKGWDISNDYDNAQASARYALKHFRERGGNAVVAAAGYYGGPGAANKAEKGIAVSDPRNPKAPNTIEYGRQVATKSASDEELAKIAGVDIQKSGAEMGKELLNLPNQIKDVYVAATSGLDKNNPADMAKYKLAKDQNWFDKTMISAGRETDKLLSGIKELGYHGAGMATTNWANKLGHPEWADSAINWEANKVKALDEEQAANDKAMKGFDAESGTWGVLGASLPYVLSQMLFGGPIAKGSQEVISTIASGPEAAVKAGKSTLVKGIDKLAATTNPISKWVGTKAKLEIGDPLTRAALQNKNAVPALPGILSGSGTIAGSGVLGAIEGGLHPDRSAEQGAISSIFGTALGNALAPFLTRSKNYREAYPNEKELVEWFKDQGGKKVIMPGHELGDPTRQKFEAGMKQTPGFAEKMREVQDQYDKVNNRIAFTAIGVKNPTASEISPADLSAHINDLKSQYETLQAGTTAHFKPTQILNLNNHLTQLQKDSTSIGKPIANDAADYIKQIELFAPARDPLTGKMKARTIDGMDIQRIRSNLRQDISDSYSNNNYLRAKSLEPLLKEVDQAIDNGVVSGKGEATAKQWRALNEKWSLAKLVEEHGLNELGRVDPSRLGNHFMASDAHRFLTETGSPSLNQLYKMAKNEYMRRNQAGSTLSGMGVHPSSFEPHPGIMTRFLGSSKQLPVITDAAFRAYLNGWPGRTGLLWMSGKGLGDPALYTRAYRQADPFPLDSVVKYIEGAGKVYDKGKNKVKRKFEDFLEE